MKLFRSARWVLLTLAFPIVTMISFAQDPLIAPVAPPDLPQYDQPVCPQSNYVWTPGYWSYGQDGYFWVPGVWVPAAYEGALWTPGYWAFERGQYAFHDGYWGDHVGYYGGVNYGYGYMGFGFAGGEWRHGTFFYNTAVAHVHFLNLHVYHDMEIVKRSTLFGDSRVAFIGGPRGIRYEPSREERMYEHEKHMGRSDFQSQHEFTARGDHGSYYNNNGGHPHITAEDRSGRPDEQHPQGMGHEGGVRHDERDSPRQNDRSPYPNSRPGPVLNAQPSSRPAQTQPQYVQPHSALQTQAPRQSAAPAAQPRPQAAVPPQRTAPAAQPKAQPRQPTKQAAPKNGSGDRKTH